MKLQKCERVLRNLVEFLNSERCKSVYILLNLVDLVKSFLASIYYLLPNIDDTAENGLPKVCQEIVRTFKLEKKLEQT